MIAGSLAPRFYWVTLGAMRSWRTWVVRVFDRALRFSRAIGMKKEADNHQSLQGKAAQTLKILRDS
jgi:hypothetical protein